MLALFVAIGGTATAVSTAVKRNSVGPKQLKRNAIRDRHLKKNQIKTKHIRDGAVTQAKLAGNIGLEGPPGPPGPPGGSGSGSGSSAPSELRAWARVMDTPGGDPTASGGGDGGDNEGVAAVNDGPLNQAGVFCFNFDEALEEDLILTGLISQPQGPQGVIEVSLYVHRDATPACAPGDDAEVRALDVNNDGVDGVDFYIAFYDMK